MQWASPNHFIFTQTYPQKNTHTLLQSGSHNVDDETMNKKRSNKIEKIYQKKSGTIQTEKMARITLK